MTLQNSVEHINSNLRDDVQALERENSSLKKKVNLLQAAVTSPSGTV